MGLPASGPISSSQIGDYLGLSSPYSLRTMSSTAGFSTPDSASEFYNYQTQSDYNEYYYYDVSQKNAAFACSFQTNDQLFYSNSADNSHLTFPGVGARLFDGEDPSTASPLNLTTGGVYGIANDTNIDVTAAITIDSTEGNLVDSVSLCP
jgi:hypothetical protein|tara:strand:+ start:837 stop:1286 length:450 start_codon:yes stop_codon:yes gene_type:complete